MKPIIIDQIKDKTKLDWCSAEMQSTLKDHGIKVFNIRFDPGLKFAFMMATHECDTRKPVILICTDDLIGADLTHAEAEAMLWHEVAHIINDATEFEADDYAVDHTSYDVWKSAMKKTYGFLHREPNGEFAHRKKYIAK